MVFLVKCYYRDNRQSLLASNWKLFFGRQEIPKQEDAHNCGLFTALFAVSIAHKLDIRVCNQGIVECLRTWLVLYFCCRPEVPCHLFAMDLGVLTKRLSDLLQEPELVDKPRPIRVRKAQVLSVQPSQDQHSSGQFVLVDVTTNQVINSGQRNPEPTSTRFIDVMAELEPNIQSGRTSDNTIGDATS